MIARHRGGERLHSRWHPTRATGLVSEHPDPELDEPLDPAVPIEPEPRLPPAGSRGSLALIGIAVVIVIAAISAHQRHRSTSAAGLPSTPRQWVEQWTAASLENPARVCQQLFAPPLAAAFKADTARSCLAHYSAVASNSFRIRHVLQDGPAAAVEAQQLGDGRKWGYFTVILSHVRGGWQGVDVVPGGSVRPR